MTLRPNLYTIAPGAPFLTTLVDALLDGRLVPGFAPRQNPLALASATLFLPTRRSIRAVREVFLDRLRQSTALLPRLLALGEVDEEGQIFDSSMDNDPLLPKSVGALNRQLGLTKLVLGWSEGIKQALLPLEGEDEPLLIPSSPGDAASLAAELGRFIDGMETERVPFERLASLRAIHGERYDQYWDLTLRFLEIATKIWPDYLAERGEMDPAHRRNCLLEGEAKRFAARRHDGPVIIAGSTGSIPSTRDLIKVVANLPDGAVILPGLDLGLDEPGWQAIGEEQGAPGHPQAGLKTLLRSIGFERNSVLRLGDCAPEKTNRDRLVCEAMRPAATTDLWAAHRRAVEKPFGENALENVSIIEAAHEGQEALAIALVLRETLETAGKRAALVTPDRALAARVAAELGRWNIAIEDSAGRRLLSTPPGIFTRLVLDVALSNFAAVPVLALLKHPFATLGLSRGTVRERSHILEIGALRGPQPPAGVAGLRKALANGQTQARSAHAQAASRRFEEAQWLDASALLDALEKALHPFAALFQAYEPQPVERLFAAHIAAVEAAASASLLYKEDDGKALASFFQELTLLDKDILIIPPHDYPGLFSSLSNQITVRSSEPRHRRIAIYGLLEARLLPFDRLVLGGLDEGVWPSQVSTDPWLNRPMRAAIGLSMPEKRIGLAAHDFAQGMGANEVIVTRALKRGGAPTIAARWLQRIKAFAQTDYRQAVARGERWVALAHQLDAPVSLIRPAVSPQPRPALALRPTRLSVTRIEDLVRDPYSIYARFILKLEPLDDIACPPGASDRGTLIHEAARRFSLLCENGVPENAEAHIVKIGEELFASYADYPDVRAFWWPRFQAVAAFLAAWESERRGGIDVRTEIKGEVSWKTAAGRPFVLSARADRIEIDSAGTVRVIDFKTGSAPTAKQIANGLSPQLALEAAIALEHGFPGVPASVQLADPLIVSLAGGSKGCRDYPITFKDETAAEVAMRSLARVKSMIDRFEDEAVPYASMLHPMFAGRRYGDYDHLARVREWSLASETEDPE